MKGFRETLAAVEALRAELDTRAAEAVGRCAETALSAAHENVPVDTGRLRASLTAKLDSNAATVGTDCEYGAFVEFGTSRMAAQPYLAPAFEAARDAASGFKKG